MTEAKDVSLASRKEHSPELTHRRVVELERLVEVIDLGEEGNDDKSKQKPEEPVLDLVVSSDSVGPKK